MLRHQANILLALFFVCLTLLSFMYVKLQTAKEAVLISVSRLWWLVTDTLS